MPVVDGLPEDAKILSVHYVTERASLCFVLEHESFPRVSQGAHIPERAVEFKLYEIQANIKTE
jgi:hypothetical protein